MLAFNAEPQLIFCKGNMWIWKNNENASLWQCFSEVCQSLGKKNQENYTWVINELLNGYLANA